MNFTCGRCGKTYLNEKLHTTVTIATIVTANEIENIDLPNTIININSEDMIITKQFYICAKCLNPETKITELSSKDIDDILDEVSKTKNSSMVENDSERGRIFRTLAEADDDTITAVREELERANDDDIIDEVSEAYYG